MSERIFVVFKKELRLQYWDIILKINTVKHTNQGRDILANAEYCQSADSCVNAQC